MNNTPPQNTQILWGKKKAVFSSFVKFLRSSKRAILLIFITAVITLVISSMISIWLSKVTNMKVPSIGTIKTIGVEAYWDPNCENKTETIDWDTICPGSSTNKTFYIRSVSNFKATLNLNATNWNPANILEYMSLCWSYNGTPVNPGEILQVTLTLSASSSYSFVHYLITNDVKDFDIVIAASG